MLVRSLLPILVLLAAVAFPVSAGAATTDDCLAQISALRADTGRTAFVNARDQTGLLGKLDNASAALAVGKNGDAIGKLTDFRTKVQALGSTGKLAADDAARLDAGAANAISCIQSIGP